MSKIFYCEYDKKIYHCNAFIKLLKHNKDYFNYYVNNLTDEIKNEVINSGNSHKYLYRVISGKQLYCVKENNLISYDRVLRGCITCSDDCISWQKGISTRGKKRPEHAIIISQKLKGVKKTCKAKESYKKRLSSIEFKKKVLENKNIKFDHNNDSDVLEKYRDWYSVDRKSIQYKKRFCLKNFNKYFESKEINNDIIYSMSDEDILKLFSEIIMKLNE